MRCKQPEQEWVPILGAVSGSADDSGSHSPGSVKSSPACAQPAESEQRPKMRQGDTKRASEVAWARAEPSVSSGSLTLETCTWPSFKESQDPAYLGVLGSVTNQGSFDH